MTSHQDFKFAQRDIDSRLNEFDVQGIEIEFRPVGIFRSDFEFERNLVVPDLVFFTDISDDSVINSCGTGTGLIQVVMVIHRKLFRTS